METPPAIDLMLRHGSVRRYSSEPVPDAALEMIIRAAQQASTSSNLQTYSVIATRDDEKKHRLKEISGGQDHLVQAPVVLLWCADFSRLERVCGYRGYDLEAGYLENFLISAVDAAIASQNAALAAEALGLGICYIGALRNDPESVSALFQLPDLVYPLFGMTLGRPVQAPLVRPRLPQTTILHKETYQPESIEDLRAYDRAMIQTGIYTGRQVGSQDEDPDAYGWMEHSARRVTKPSRPHLRDTIIKSGFLLK